MPDMKTLTINGTTYTLSPDVAISNGSGNNAVKVNDLSNNLAAGIYSVAEGYQTEANGSYTHAQNFGTIAQSAYQTAIGRFNVVDSTSTYSLIIGNGTASSRSNCLTVTWDGNVTNGSSASTSRQYYQSINSNATVGLSLEPSGRFGLFDFTNSRWILYGEEGTDYVVGRTTSGSSLYLAGTISTDGQRVSHLFCNASYIQFNGQWGTTGTTYATRSLSCPSSDVRLKEHIKDSSANALGLINSINIREFDWTDGREDPHWNIGMVADEIEKLDPKLTVGGGFDEDGSMNVKSINTFYLIGYLTKAIQELSAEIEELKANK